MVWNARLKGRALLVGALVTGGIALWGALAYEGERVVYAKRVDEVVRDAQRLAGKALRVEGVLEPSSLKMGGSPCLARFVLTGVEKRLPVVYPSCTLPDSFCTVPGWDIELELVVQGELDARTGIFEAEQVLARCPGKYQRKQMMLDGGLTGMACPCF